MDNLIVSGDYAYVRTEGQQVKVLDVSDPSNPHEVAVLEDFNNVRDLEVYGNYLVVADNWDGLKVFDMSTPSNPVHVTTYYIQDRAYRIAIYGNYAYVAALWRGLRIIDISDPLNPWEVGAYEEEGFHAYEVGAHGDYVYVEEDDYKMRILDVTDPQNPTYVSTYDYNTYGLYDIKASGSIAFLASMVPGVILVDITDPQNPIKIDEINWFICQSIVIKENRIYALNRDAGLVVFDLQPLLFSIQSIWHDSETFDLAPQEVQPSEVRHPDRVLGLQCPVFMLARASHSSVKALHKAMSGHVDAFAALGCLDEHGVESAVEHVEIAITVAQGKNRRRAAIGSRPGSLPALFGAPGSSRSARGRPDRCQEPKGT